MTARKLTISIAVKPTGRNLTAIALSVKYALGVAVDEHL